MTEHRANRRSIPAALAALALATACGGKGGQQPAADQPAREIQLAPSTAAQPQLADVPAKAREAPRKVVRPKTPAPKPQEAAPAPQPAAPAAPAPAPPSVVVKPLAPAAPATGSIAAGTTFPVQSQTRVCTNTFKAGDRFTTTLTQPLQGSNGAYIPAGSPVVMRVVESATSGKDSSRLSFDVVSVRIGDQNYEVDGRAVPAAPLEKVRVQSTTDQAKKVGAGAAIGAIVGQLFGHNTRSTVVGAAVGAAAGGAVAAGTMTYNACLPANAAVTVTLARPLTVRTK